MISALILLSLQGTDDDSTAPLELPLDRIPIEELSGEERDEAEAQLHSRLEEEYFLSCDLNGNGWLSFREGAGQLRMDRVEFFRFDTDADGRIGREEFGTRYRHAVETVGSFRPPTSAKKLFETPEDSPLIYDFNDTGALEEGELRAFLADKGITVPVEPMMELLDKNESAALEPIEFQDIVETLEPLLPGGEIRPEDIPGAPGLPGFPGFPGLDGALVFGAAPTTVEELFGARQPRPQALGNAPMPDLIAGPVPHFHRLDYDGDGRIDEADLMDLLRPAHSEVRVSAVLAALDRDGDGGLSESELRIALTGR